jgi:hypothetical protein
MTSQAGQLYAFTDLTRYAIHATDGDIGGVEDLYFDELSWTVRYLVVDTGTWLPGRKVLVTPSAVSGIDVSSRRVITGLTRRQVEESPSIDTDKPVSRQYETQFYSHYGYTPYWAGPYRWGPVVYPDGVPLSTSPAAGWPAHSAVAEELAAREREGADPYLQSAAAVRGYTIQATDGALGHVEDYLIDPREWVIRYVVVDPRSWWPGEHVIVAPDWITAVDWNESRVHVEVTKEAVRGAPTYRPGMVMDRDQETALHTHHGRPGYWDRPPADWRRPRSGA